MWEKLLNKESFTGKDVDFVVKNQRTAPKELLAKLGLSNDPAPVVEEEITFKEEAPVVEEKKTRRGRKS